MNPTHIRNNIAYLGEPRTREWAFKSSTDKGLFWSSIQTRNGKFPHGVASTNPIHEELGDRIKSFLLDNDVPHDFYLVGTHLIVGFAYETDMILFCLRWTGSIHDLDRD